MANLARSPARPPGSPRSRLLLVRQPVRTVGAGAEGSRLLPRLAIGVVAAVGGVAAVWLMGEIGHRLGFAPLVRAPELAPQTGGGITAGTMMLTALPRVIFGAGIAQPAWLMLGFAMIAIPAAALAAARPLTPGGPRLKSPVLVIAHAGAVGSMLSGALLIWWTGSPARAELLRMLPLDPLATEAWQRDLQTAAGLDALAVVAAALWTVLVLRLPVPLWMRSIAATAALFTLVVSVVAMSISNASASLVHAARPLGVLDDGVPRLVLGSTPHHLATIAVLDGRTVVEMRNHPDAIPIMGRASIVEYLSERAPGE